MTDYKKILSDGALARKGLLNKQAIEEASAFLVSVTAKNLETVRVVFADQHGILRGKTIVAGALPSIFANGLAMASTLFLKDTSHRTVFPVWSEKSEMAGIMHGANDIRLIPDPSTFRVLPWTDNSAWIFCDTYLKDGKAISFSPRSILRSAVDALEKTGRSLKVGLEVEFQIFEVIDTALDHASSTMPGRPVQTRNLTQGYQFLTETKFDAAEFILNELRQNCEALGLPLRSMEIEMGPSQFEFTFEPSDPMTHADNMMMFRTMAKEVSARNGLHATFMCKPNLDNAAASGWHLHQSLVDIKTGSNLMVPTNDDKLNDVTSAWIAGLLEHAAETCLLTTPTVNGYKRYRPHQLAPDSIQWGRDNRGTMIRALLAQDDNASRIENRVAETTANPYYYFASQILCGMDGLARNLQAPEAVESPYDGKAEKLPESLLSAIQAFKSSKFYREKLGDEFVDYLCHIRQSEWDRYHLAISEWEQAEYFGLY